MFKKLSIKCSTFLFLIYHKIFLFQVVGSRGSVHLNPRHLITKEGSVIGVKMTAVTQVKN